MATFQDFYKGIGKSRADQSGFDNMVNVDPHTEIGFVTPQLALTTDSSTPNEPCISAVTPSGTVYLFSTTSGKIWKRATDGTYSSVTTNANTVHRGAKHFNGVMYYWTATKLGKFTSETEASRNDSFGTFANSQARGAEEANLSLFICDGKYLAAVDNVGSFSQNVLDIPADKQTTCIKKVGTDILIGSIIGTSVNACSVYLWDTYSSSWTLEDELPENGVNTFIDGDNVAIAQCGGSGALYYWNGSTMQSFDNKLRDVTTGVNPWISCVYNKRPTIAIGSKIFTIFKQFAASNYAIVQEYTSSGTVQSLVSTGSQLITSTSTGTEKIGTSYAVGTIDTPELSNIVNGVYVDHDVYGQGVGISVNSNHGGYVSFPTIVDDLHSKVFFDGGLPDSVTTQARITLTASGSNVPKIKSIEIK